MWKQIAIAGAVGGAILGTGAAALAETGSGSPSAAPTASTAATAGATSTTPSAAGAGRLGAKVIKALGRVEHGELVTQGKDGDVTHDVVAGQVTAVSASSITVKAKDGYSETFAVSADTVVRVKGSGKAAIGLVKVNDRVAVSGIKVSSTVTAKQVLDAGTK